ncbi:hypothetical protein MIND_01012600 [Mycena indigotica]|uniref:Uncharacterized protein n=1 Tax=Mycena indigotica TaxID=2126181 RepID=A0A8H6VUU4_9AGAR|nr:uncharacterized protein MIND_01012600 [Mycena indigotica]KAF7294752.1 hypothetical protein MIND_01012600 [Mycena indigotica]
MQLLLASVPLALALLSSAVPLGSGAVRRHAMASNFDIPSSCSSSGSISSQPISISDPGLASVDNSTVIASSDNSTISDADLPSDDPDSDLLDSSSTVSANITRRWGYSDLQEYWWGLCSNLGSSLYDDCINLGFDSFDALSAEADVCDQQSVSDRMISWAKSSGCDNWQDFVDAAVSYRQLPRESVMLYGFYPSTPYCNSQPTNIEIYGIWNQQAEGVTPGLYGGPNYPITPFGDDASCPFGRSPNLRTCECVSSFYSTDLRNLPGAPNTILGSDSEQATATISADTSEETATESASTTDAADSEATDAASSDDSDDSTDSSDDLSATDSAADATATTEIDGDVNDPNGRRRKRLF